MNEKYVLPKFVRKLAWKFLAKHITINRVYGDIYGIYAYYYLFNQRIATIDIYTYLVNFD